MNKKEIEKQIKELVESCNMELVELNLKSGNSSLLEVIIYKEAGISLDDCTFISRLIESKLDLNAFFTGNYNIEVASPGLDRKLVTLDDYRRNLGKTLELRLYQKIEDLKEYIGVLENYDEEFVYFCIDTEKVLKIERKNISLMRQYIDFGGK